MTTSISIHTAIPESIPNLIELQAKCFGPESKWCGCMWSRALATGKVLVAVDDEEGEVGFGVVDGPRVLGVGVWRPLREQGLGRKLLTLLEGSVTRVREDNETGQLWLKACGWKCVRVVKGNPTYYEFSPAPVEAKPKRKRAAKKKS